MKRILLAVSFLLALIAAPATTAMASTTTPTSSTGTVQPMYPDDPGTWA